VGREAVGREAVGREERVGGMREILSRNTILLLLVVVG